MVRFLLSLKFASCGLSVFCTSEQRSSAHTSTVSEQYFVQEIVNILRTCNEFCDLLHLRPIKRCLVFPQNLVNYTFLLFKKLYENKILTIISMYMFFMSFTRNSIYVFVSFMSLFFFRPFSFKFWISILIRIRSFQAFHKKTVTEPHMIKLHAKGRSDWLQ